MAMPRGASAQGGLIDFIESLSGPGPFRGAGVVWRIACMRSQPMSGFRGSQQAPWLLDRSCKNDSDVVVDRVKDATGIVRPQLVERPVRQLVEVRALWATTDQNHRPVLLADPTDTRNVNTFKLDGVVAFRLAPFLDLGAGGGLIGFYVADGTVNGQPTQGTTLYRPIIVPVSVTFTPFAIYHPTTKEKRDLKTNEVTDFTLSGGSKARRFVRIRLDVNYIPFGFRGEDWSKPEVPTNDYSTDGNWVLSGGVILDVGTALFGLNR
jgi:hypothetical protein